MGLRLAGHEQAGSAFAAGLELQLIAKPKAATSPIRATSVRLERRKVLRAGMHHPVFRTGDPFTVAEPIADVPPCP